MTCPDCISKAQRVEHLERECRELNEARVIVKLVERDLRRAFENHLGTSPPLRLPLESMIDLVRATANKQGYEEGFRKGAAMTLKTHMPEIVAAALPHLRSLLQNAFTIPVLIRPNDENSLMKYRAISLRGTSKQVRGTTPEEAYGNLKDTIASSIACRPELLANLHPRELMQEYRAAKPLFEGEIGGFRVEIRVSERVA